MQNAGNCFRKVNFEVSNTQVTELIGCLSQEASLSDFAVAPAATLCKYS